jgi:hypothetical protein
MKAFVEEFESIGSFILDIHDYLIYQVEFNQQNHHVLCKSYIKCIKC